MPTSTGAAYEDRPGQRRPGGRTERNRLAVAQAALDLLRQGQTELAPAIVAQESGVSVRTIYRRWPTQAALVREALTLHSRSLRIPDTGTFDTDVHALARALARFYSDPTEIELSATMASNADPEFIGLQIEFTRDHFDLARPFERAIESGQISAAVDIAVLLDLLIGPMIMRTVVMRRRLKPSYITRLAEAVIDAARAAA
ncbi:MAG: TetR/AcrR family transcriptional regulator C-terminal ligand-binding domain-containing protein [Deltaproteobacteria bacterium]|nr:TetR/AcrR family transcriptional regulator C-terminal ligand-binding domain-containing protein [Deltaproteobacteria bacterium]